MINMLCGMRMAIHKFLEGGDCILFFILPVLTWCLVAWCLVFSDQDHSVQFSRSVVSDFLRPHESQHARPPCPSPTPGVHSDSRPSSHWCFPIPNLAADMCSKLIIVKNVTLWYILTFPQSLAFIKEKLCNYLCYLCEFSSVLQMGNLCSLVI